MGTELLEIGVKVRKGVIFTIRGCFRSVCNHPFLVGVLCFLIFLYRSSPLIFSLLVTASPVLICTAILLGTLLSFGQPNIPDIEREEKTTHEVVSMKMVMSGDATVVEKNESGYAERYSEKKRDEAEQLTELPSLSARGVGDVCREASSDDTAPLIQKKSQETELESSEVWGANRELGVMRSKQKTEWNEARLSDGEAMDNHYASIPKMNDDERLESDYDKSEAESFDSERVNVDSLDSPPRSPWKQVDDREDEEEEDDGALDSGSDRAESSSPDASMADIMPMLDELHPLLDEEAPQPVHMSHDGSDAASERSPKSSISSHESDDETENHEDLEVADEDNEDGEDEEDAQGDKEEQTKSAITWTEEDQKNLMDLGSSEIERNQRLENLILRRRSRKNMSMVLERNLIDLESSDLGFNIAPISTTRHNPFDLPHDSYDNSGLPPIPGSAPSILLPRRNPFDIPYDSSEEKPNLLGGGFQEEFTTFQSREPFFRRHESFNVGPSIFAPNRQERQDVKLRPYFVPERMVSEEASYSPFQRQSSELSDSKVSSVPETESLGSVEDLEDRRLSEEDNLPALEAIYGIKEVIEEVPSGDPEMISTRENTPEEYAPREPELISEMEHVSEHVGHGSQSSEEDESLELGQVEKRDVEVDELEFQLGEVENHCEESSVAQPLEDTGYHSNSEAVEQRYSRDSSSSSLSEVSERVFNEMEGERMPILEQRSDGIGEEPGISTQTSVGSTNLSITLVDGAPHREPVYDSSPPSVRKNFSSSSISSDLHAESDLGLPSALVKRTVSFIEREYERSSQEIEKDIPSNIQMLPESSTHHLVNENESAQIDVSNIGDPGNISSHFSGVVQSTASSAKASVEENLMDQQTQGQVPSSSSHGLVKSSEYQNLSQSEGKKHLLISERETLQVSVPSVKGHQLTPDHAIDKEEIAQSPNSDVDVYHEAYEKLMSTPSAGGNSSHFYDKAVQEPTPKHRNEVQAPNTSLKSFEEGQSIQNLDIQEVRDLDRDISSYVNSPLSPDFISIPSSASEIASPPADMQTIIEEEDEIKDIDEGLLSELDSVGDFSIKQWGSGSNEFKRHRDSIGESLSSADHAETSTTDVVEVNPVEVNKIEHAMHSENLREVIDIHEEEMECISELQTLETGIAEHIDISNKEFNERDGQDSPDQETSEEEMTFSKENEVEPADSVVIHDYADDRDVMFLSKRAESTSVETEVMVERAEASPQTQVDMDATSGMLELEARTLEVIDLVFKKSSDKEIEKPVILETPQAKLVIGETKAEHLEYGTLHRNSDFTDSTHETPIPEVRSIEDATLDCKQVTDAGTESRILPDSVNHILHECDSRETLGTPSELHMAEATSAEGTSLPTKHVLDGEREKQQKPNFNDDGLIEFNADKEDSCLDTESSVKEISTAATEKPDHEVGPLENLHSTKSGKGKGKISKSSSSSSSSSSESSSSDSD